MKRMIIDTANLLFRVAAAHQRYSAGGTPEEQAGLAMHTALHTLNKYYKKYRPDQLAVTFEGNDNWRKEYTRSSECKSKRVYKANRVKDPSRLPFFELINSFEQLARQHTSLVCLSHPKLEGDDLIAGYAQRFSKVGDEVIIISGDKDFVQLLKYPNVVLLDPSTGKPRTVEAVCGVDDAEFFIFEKCIRGDKSDNVFPALPRVLKRRLLKAYSDDYELTKLMNEEWTFKDPATGDEITYRVQELFEENNLLMNLERQPDHIRNIIERTLDHELVHHGKFSHFHFLKFCGKYELKQIAESALQFTEMLSVTGQRSPLKDETRAVHERQKKALVEY